MRQCVGTSILTTHVREYTDDQLRRDAGAPGTATRDAMEASRFRAPAGGLNTNGIGVRNGRTEYPHPLT